MRLCVLRSPHGRRVMSAGRKNVAEERMTSRVSVRFTGKAVFLRR